MSDQRSRLIVFCHPSPDLYGSDLQLLQTVDAFPANWTRIAVLPEDGPLIERLSSEVHTVVVAPFPVLRRSILSPLGAVVYCAHFLRALLASTRILRKYRPDVAYINTITIPVWILAARITGVRAVVHVHEAEDRGTRLMRRVLLAPLLLSNRIIVNSRASLEQLLLDSPRLSDRSTVVYNGVPDPGAVAQTHGADLKVVFVGRLSPRKGTDLALEAVAILRREGIKVRLDVCGEAFAGYEWYRDQLTERASEKDLAGSVNFLGYVRNPADILAGATAAVVPSRLEPFGNVAVEAMLAGIPVVAARIQGLTEIVSHGVNGRLFDPGDAKALADELRSLIDDPLASRAMGRRGRAYAQEHFGLVKYRQAVLDVVSSVGKA